MSRTAKAFLLGSFVCSAGIIFTVHYMQRKESETMYAGVLRDDVRRRDKLRKRQEELEESQRKRAIYERVQPISPHTSQEENP